MVSDSVDVILSNCVINLSPDKPAVFREAHRVLKPGGRIAVSDIALGAPLSAAVRETAQNYVACLSGALPVDAYIAAVEAAGFTDVRVTRTSARAMFEGALSDPNAVAVMAALDPAEVATALDAVYSVSVEARKA